MVSRFTPIQDVFNGGYSSLYNNDQLSPRQRAGLDIATGLGRFTNYLAGGLTDAVDSNPIFNGDGDGPAGSGILRLRSLINGIENSHSGAQEEFSKKSEEAANKEFKDSVNKRLFALTSGGGGGG